MIVARLSSLDPARGNLGLCGIFILWFKFMFFPFGCEVGLSCFNFSTLFLLLFLVAICLEVEN